MRPVHIECRKEDALVSIMQGGRVKEFWGFCSGLGIETINKSTSEGDLVFKFQGFGVWNF